jgi:hypothetical protein
MRLRERLMRMRERRQIIQAQDIFWWLDTFLDVALVDEHGASATSK